MYFDNRIIFMFRKLTILMLPAIALLSACGFSPIYGNYNRSDSASIEKLMGQIQIANIPNKEGVFLRNELIDRFSTNGYPQNPRYTLHVSNIQEQSTNLDITKSSDATRAQLKLSSNFTLIDTETRDVIMSRRLRAITSYNILSSQFTTRVSEQDAREAALNELANQIETAVSLHFNK